MMLLAIGAMLAIIIFTGYLIIYNVFQISVTNDIRFYGLLKTIGTTGRQIKTILRQQALLLSCIGIPIGLVAGWLVGPHCHCPAGWGFQPCLPEPGDLCGGGPVLPADGLPLLRQARPDGGQGLAHRGGAVHRGLRRETEGETVR